MQTQDPHAAESGIRLTPLGEAYAIAQARPYGCPDGVEPRLWRQALESRAERHLSLATALIAMLDVMDGDPDLEPALAGLDGGPQDDRESDELERGELDSADSEPSLGWTDMEARYGAAPTFDPDREADDADDEPSLASPEPRFAGGDYYEQQRRIFSAARPISSQERWTAGKRDDMEDEHDGLEPENEHGGDVQDEPHDEEPDLEYSHGVDATDASTTEWTPERPTEEYVGPGAKFTNPRRKHVARQQELRQAGTGHQGQFHGLILNRMPPRYIMQVEGDCLDPLVPNGARIEVSSTDRAREGDFVVIYRYAQFVRAGEWQTLVKRLVWDARQGEVTPVAFRNGEPVGLGHGVLAEMLNPARKLFYPVEHVEAVHKVTRILPAGERGIVMTPAEVAVMGLAQ